MSNQQSRQDNQNLNILGSTLQGVQIGGIAGNDMNLTQIQGGIGSLNVLGTVQLAQSPIGETRSLSQKEYRWRQLLIDKVKKYWIEALLERSLYKQVLIDLNLQERKEFVQRPLRKIQEFSEDSKDPFPAGTNASEIFERIGLGRTLLILGEPGAGKTITLLKLAQSLVNQLETQTDLSQALPVVLNLSSWAKKRLPIVEWLIQELYDTYRLPISIAKNWIENEQLVLLLDGFDEVAAESRESCLHSLNSFIREYGLTEMVICSRIKEYEVLPERLELRSAIYVKPLTHEQVNQFLDYAGEQLAALKVFINQDPDLCSFVSSPLILNIMSLTYQGYSLDMLPPQKQQNQLFEAYVKRMFQRKIMPREYSPEKSIQWLAWLARTMLDQSETIFWIEKMQPKLLNRGKLRNSEKALVLLLYTIFNLVRWALPFWLIRNEFLIIFPIGFEKIILISIIFGVVDGIAFMSGQQRIGGIYGLSGMRWSHKRMIKNLRKNSLSIIKISIASSILMGILFMLIFGSFKGFVIAAPITFLFYPVFFMYKLGQKEISDSLSEKSKINEENVPAQEPVSLWTLYINAGIRLLILALLIAFPMLLLGEYSYALKFFLFFLIISITNPGIFAILLLRGILYFHGVIPLNYSHFLNFASERLFLQKIGEGYTFVHRMLLEYFANLEIEEKAEKVKI